MRSTHLALNEQKPLLIISQITSSCCMVQRWVAGDATRAGLALCHCATVPGVCGGDCAENDTRTVAGLRRQFLGR